MAVARYLADTSALARLHRPAVEAVLARLIEAAQVAICGPIELELLRTARGHREYDDRRAYLRTGFEYLPAPDDVWQRAGDVQAALAARGAHRAASIPDLLIAAVAERHGVTVLHYDADYELIAEVTGQLCEWVVPRGTADRPG
jgi:predicted nucleic acid-binding protein